jgi:beta-glucosidase
MSNPTGRLGRDALFRLALLAASLTALAAAPPAPKAGPQPPPAQDLPRYRDARLAIGDRVADLVPRMTLEEKVAEVSTGIAYQGEVVDPTGTFTTAQARGLLARWWDPDLVIPARRSAILRNGVQRYLREKTRLGSPSRARSATCRPSTTTSPPPTAPTPSAPASRSTRSATA